MPSKSLTKYAVPDNTNRADDIQSPYSYKEWLVRNTGIVPGKEFRLYHLYLTKWYRGRVTKASVEELTKSQYKALLEELSIVFENDTPENAWLKQINFDDDADLAVVIPFYARKLKEIALYLSTKRETIKQAKLKYNMVGAVQALEKIFYSYFLNAFTKKESALGISDLSLWSKFPELSAVRKDFSLQIEELFDDEEYFDKNPSIGSSVYFDLSSEANTDYYSAINFPVSALDWLYQTGFAYMSANNSLTWTESGELADNGASALNGMPISAFELEDYKRLNVYNYFDLSKQYLGTTQWIASGGYFGPSVKSYTYDILAGNNWFYWPAGEYFNEAETNITLDPIRLSATNFTFQGTAGDDYRNSDIIFVYKDNQATGAWLKSIDYVTQNLQMSAILEPRNRTIFKFPWPGVGLSAEDIPWQGKTLSNLDKAFEYLDEGLKKDILNAYFDEHDTIHKIAPILLNDTTLIDAGAFAANNYLEADKIIVRPEVGADAAHDVTPNSVFTANQQYAWLYKFLSTQIPVEAGQTTQVLWPLERINEVIPNDHLEVVCNNQALSSLDVHYAFAGSTAGTTLATSDWIIKQNAFGSAITGFAWLSGKPTSTLGATGSAYNSTIQAGWVNFKATPGEYVVFLWTGPDNTPANTLIHWHDHANDCPYKVLAQTLKPLERELLNMSSDLGAKRWSLCTCRAFHYSPCGHSGAITDYYHVHDFILEDFDYPDSFDIGAWRDSGNNPYTSSQYFGWYKQTAAGLGYGPGSFVRTDNGAAFNLRKGHIYRYYRTNLKRNTADWDIPYLVVRAPSSGAVVGGSETPNYPKWIKAHQVGGTWVSSGTTTDMILRPGDVLGYYHFNPTRTLDPYTTQDEAINYMITAPLSGWDYTNNVVSSTGVGAKPYWAFAEDDAVATASKGTPVYGNAIKIVSDYLQTTQPSAANISLTNDLYFEYERKGNSVIWVQPIQLSTLINIQMWMKLLSDTKLTPFSDLVGGVSALSLSATQTPSDIVLEPISNLKPVFINYYALSGFTTTQELSNTSLGSPPDGGVWVPPVSSIYVIPSRPYANLSNRHFPTIATVQNLDRLQSTGETGGYFTPKGLGALTYFGKHFKTGWNID